VTEQTRAVRLSTGFEIPLDGDLLAVIEALYKEVTLGDGLNSSFETMRAEVLSVIDQMSEEDRRNYLAESLFLNSVTYENEMLSAYVRRLGSSTAPPAARAGKTAAKAKKPSKPAPRPKTKAGRKSTPRKPAPRTKTNAKAKKRR
jgi:hypothetical protein